MDGCARFIGGACWFSGITSTISTSSFGPSGRSIPKAAGRRLLVLGFLFTTAKSLFKLILLPASNWWCQIRLLDQSYSIIRKQTDSATSNDNFVSIPECDTIEVWALERRILIQTIQMCWKFIYDKVSFGVLKNHRQWFVPLLLGVAPEFCFLTCDNSVKTKVFRSRIHRPHFTFPVVIDDELPP